MEASHKTLSGLSVESLCINGLFTYLFAVVDHTITLSTKENSFFSCCHGTDGFVYVKLVGSSGTTTPWQLVTSGGKVYADENEGGE